ncbi:MAG: mannosyltransferase family protein [Chloroflexota bacterium]
MFAEITSGLAILGKRFTPAEVAQGDRSLPAGDPVVAVSRRTRAGEAPLPVGRILRQAAAMWLATRIGYAIFTYFSVIFSAQRSHGSYSAVAFPPSRLLAAWNRWDTQWYGTIALHGYHEIHRAAFFPLYPACIHVVTLVIGTANVVAASLIVSNLATLAAFAALGLLAATVFGPNASSHTIRAFAAFPLAFFLVGGYSDSLFVALAFVSLFFARRDRFVLACICAFLATFTRLFGIVLILPLLWEYVVQHREAKTFRLSFSLVEGVIGVALAVPAALILWALFLRDAYGDPFAYLTVQKKDWGHYSVPPWEWFQSAFTTLHTLPGWSFLQARVLFDLVPVVIFAILTIVAARRIPVSFSLYMLGTIAICVTSLVPLNFDPFTGQGRYMLMAAPVFILLGSWMRRYPWLDVTVVGLGFLLQGLFTAFFLRGGWLV